MIAVTILSRKIRTGDVSLGCRRFAADEQASGSTKFCFTTLGRDVDSASIALPKRNSSGESSYGRSEENFKDCAFARKAFEINMAETSVNSRLEAFCDGVFAIALTLLILDLRIPASASIATTRDLWLALAHLLPPLFSFLLSFAVVLICWANHHAALKLVNKSSSPFIYANGLLLLSIVFLPFPTALLGEYFLTDHSAPAVILYSGICGFQACGWICLTSAALNPDLPLTKNEKSALALRQNRRYGYFALTTYTLLAIAALWFPRTIAIAIALIWVIWIVIGIETKDE